jgi:glutamyl-tRNA synthetase/nondiscriminating glutamyl-tRNA synthetase
MSTTKTRVRFAPSPTGLLHVGNARTALYNWLFARHTGGDFILRIEDTDLERSEERHEAQLMEDLRWMGLGWDEGPAWNGFGGGPHGPYRQSERLEIYRAHTDRLLAGGKAYRCFCTPEELEAERKLAAVEHRPQIYSRRCLAIPAAEAEARAAAGEHFAVRLFIPDRPLRFHDLVRGDVEFAADSVSDPVLVRSASGVSAGVPVYNYVVTVDDALMEITHVIRGDDHISNTPKQVAIYEAFGWNVPKFAHLSTILGADRERLSKRHGATSIASFRELGILPEALVNYLALLGWGAEGGLRETFTPEELVKEFKLERVTASPAVFDFDKLSWLNRHYLKVRLDQQIEPLIDLAIPYLRAAGLYPLGDLYAGVDREEREVFEPWDRRYVAGILRTFLSGVDRLNQLPERAKAILLFDGSRDRIALEDRSLLESESAKQVIERFKEGVLCADLKFHADSFKALIGEVKNSTGVKGKELFHPIRIIVTGSHSGPEFDKLIPVIEEGSGLALPSHIPSVRERVERFFTV